MLKDLEANIDLNQYCLLPTYTRVVPIWRKSDAQIGLDDDDDGYRLNSRARPAQRLIRLSGLPLRRLLRSNALLSMHLLYDGPMQAFANGQMCSLNPYYAGSTTPARRSNRRHRHVQ